MAFTLVIVAACAPAQVSTGVLRVAVKGADGKALGAAAITLRQESRGFEASSVSDDTGVVQFSQVPPGAGYRVRVAADGYEPAEADGLEILVGQTVLVELAPRLQAATFSASVEATMPALDLERAQQSQVIEQTAIENLPINQRSFLDFSLLTPGVLGSFQLPEAADYRISTGPSSGLSFNGANGRNNNLSLDGFYINGYSGNVRPSLPQTAIQEFQVARLGYPAEQGWASGGTVNIVSKSGTNDWHGNLFGYLRHRSVQARNFFDPEKSAYTRVQSGADLGGPVLRDRTFVFLGFERLDRHETAFVPILQSGDPFRTLTRSQSELLGFMDSIAPLQPLSAQLRTVLTPANNPAVEPLFRSNSGTFPFSAARSQGSARVDHRIGAKAQVFARFNITRESDQNARFGAITGYSAGSAADVADQAVTAAATFLWSQRWSGTSRFGLSSTSLDSRPNDPLGPQLDVSGYGVFGRDPSYPLQVTERYLQMQQLASYHSGKLSLNFGADLNWTRTLADVQNFFGGKFAFGEYIPLAVLMNSAAGDPGFAASLGQTLTALGKPNLVANLSAPINSLQAFSLGLPAFYIQVFGDTGYQAWRQMHAGFVNATYRARPGLTFLVGLRHQYVVPAFVNSRNDLLPRIGFAWTPAKTASFAVRGAYGLFRDPMVSTMSFAENFYGGTHVNFVVIPLTGVPGVVNPQTGQPVNSADVYQHLIRTGVLGRRTIQRSDLAPLGIPANFRFPVTGGIPDNYKLPYSQQAHLTLEGAWRGTVASLGFEWSRAQHLWRIIDTNLVKAGTRPDGYPVYAPKNPALANYYNIETSGNSQYYAMVLQASRRWRNGFAFNAWYTFGRAIDDVTDYFIDYAPMDPLNRRAERALSLFHAKHRFVASGVYESPLKASRGGGWRSAVLGDWLVAPIVRVNSARPFNVLTGVDLLGDGLTTNDRPLYLGRNAGTGPDFASIDLRLTRPFPLAKDGRVRLVFTAEVFNLANRTNFATVNNIVGPVSIEQLPKPIAGRAGSPIEPLAFASAYDPRQFQFGLRVQF